MATINVVLDLKEYPSDDSLFRWLRNHWFGENFLIRAPVGILDKVRQWSEIHNDAQTKKWMFVERNTLVAADTGWTYNTEGITKIPNTGVRLLLQALVTNSPKVVAAFEDVEVVDFGSNVQLSQVLPGGRRIFAPSEFGILDLYYAPGYPECAEEVSHDPVLLDLLDQWWPTADWDLKIARQRGWARHIGVWLELMKLLFDSLDPKEPDIESEEQADEYS